MRDDTIEIGLPGVIRALARSEMPLLREHLLRLDSESRHDRFNGFADESFIERYAAKCQADGTMVIAYLENGKVLAAAELHPPGSEPDSQPEVAFSVERPVRRKGLGSILFQQLIEEAKRKGYDSLRITTGSQNEAMRALANKFGAHLTFRYGESTGEIDLRQQAAAHPSASAALTASPANWLKAFARVNRDYWDWVFRLYGLGRIVPWSLR